MKQLHKWAKQKLVWEKLEKKRKIAVTAYATFYNKHAGKMTPAQDKKLKALRKARDSAVRISGIEDEKTEKMHKHLGNLFSKLSY